MGVNYEHFAKRFKREALALVDYIREWRLDEDDSEMEDLISAIEETAFMMRQQERINNPKQ